MTKCWECETRRAKHEDPRDPPLDEGDTLCTDCYEWVLELVIEAKEDELSELKTKLALLKAPKARK